MKAVLELQSPVVTSNSVIKPFFMRVTLSALLIKLVSIETLLK